MGESGKGQGNAMGDTAKYNVSGETSDLMATVRLGFIRKVFMLLTLQLAVTFSIVLLFNLVDSINAFCRANGSWLFWVSFILSFAILIGITCNPRIAREHPTNLYASLWVLILLGMITPFYSGTGNLIYSGLGALIFSLYMVYDAQLIFGGKRRKYQFDIDAYVFASLALYLDIVNLFLIILGGGRRD